jgi:hypothetical protein
MNEQLRNLLIFLVRSMVAAALVAAVLTGCARLGVYLIEVGHTWLAVLWFCWAAVFLYEIFNTE